MEKRHWHTGAALKLGSKVGLIGKLDHSEPCRLMQSLWIEEVLFHRPSLSAWHASCGLYETYRLVTRIACSRVLRGVLKITLSVANICASNTCEAWDRIGKTGSFLEIRSSKQDLAAMPWERVYMLKRCETFVLFTMLLCFIVEKISFYHRQLSWNGSQLFFRKTVFHNLKTH